MTNRYIGCYLDQSIGDMSMRDFDQYINQDAEPLWKDITVPRCLGACATLGYRYAGLSVSSCFRTRDMQILKYTLDWNTSF